MGSHKSIEFQDQCHKQVLHLNKIPDQKKEKPRQNLYLIIPCFLMASSVEGPLFPNIWKILRTGLLLKDQLLSTYCIFLKLFFFSVGRSYTCMENCEYAALTLLALFSHSCDFLCELHCICQFYISSAVVLPILFSFILLQDNFAKQAT